MSEPRLLFLGEGPRAAYLEGALQTAFTVTRVLASETVAEAGADLAAHDLLLFSDYPGHRLAAEEHARVVDLVTQQGTGLLMIGGWSSFGGPRGSWHGKPVADLLPVTISPTDDRTNTPLGTVLLARAEPHPAIVGIQGQEPCVVVGYNDVRARPDADVLVHGYRLRVDARPRPEQFAAISTAEGTRLGRGIATPGPTARFNRADAPILAVWQYGAGRVAALAPDVSPHWAGGIVDWGSDRTALRTGAEVGHLYVTFLVDLCRWLVRA